jgi:hypothetical protein
MVVVKNTSHIILYTKYECKSTDYESLVAV